MSEMVERVARALWVQTWGMGDVFDRTLQRGGGDTAESQAMFDRVRSDARAAIAALREPTDEQRNRYFEMKRASGMRDCDSVFMDAEWERMVDAALAEG